MKREINEDMLKQCPGIKIECHNIAKCKRKKFCRNTSELSHDKRLVDQEGKSCGVCHNKDLYVMTNNSESYTFKA